MKRLLIILVLAMVLVATAAGDDSTPVGIAGTRLWDPNWTGAVALSKIVTPPEVQNWTQSHSMTFTLPEGSIEISRAEKYLMVTVYPKGTDPIVYRVWPCGRIEQRLWKEVAPNQERGGNVFYTIPSTKLFNFDDTLMIK